MAHPVNARAAGLLGLDLLDGVAASGGRIAVGGGICLDTGGPSLTPGQPVAWTVRREFVRICQAPAADHPADDDPTEAYPGTVEETRPVGGGAEVAVRLGEARLRALVERGGMPPLGPCRLAINPSAIQVWPYSAEPYSAEPYSSEAGGPRG